MSSTPPEVDRRYQIAKKHERNAQLVIEQKAEIEHLKDTIQELQKLVDEKACAEDGVLAAIDKFINSIEYSTEKPTEPGMYLVHEWYDGDQFDVINILKDEDELFVQSLMEPDMECPLETATYSHWLKLPELPSMED